MKSLVKIKKACLTIYRNILHLCQFITKLVISLSHDKTTPFEMSQTARFTIKVLERSRHATRPNRPNPLNSINTPTNKKPHLFF